MTDPREQIELFALGKLSGEALESFRARLAADPEFAALVARDVEMLQAIRASDEVDALRRQLTAMETSWDKPDAPAPRRRRGYFPLRSIFWVAAGLLLLTLALVLFFRAQQAKSPEEIFAEHFDLAKTLETPGLRRGDPAHPRDGLADAPFFALLYAMEDELRSGNTALALETINRLRAMPKSSGYSDRLAWHAGLARLQNGDAEAAILEFESIKEEYPGQKPWFVALAKLKAGQTEQAKSDFERIRNSTSPYAAEAGAILMQLK